MVQCNSIETHNLYPNLNNQEQFRLNKINEINDCLVAKNKGTQLMSKRLEIYCLFGLS